MGRYCIVDIRAWEGAGELEVGDHIWSISGEWGRVEAVSVSHDPQLMYNLTVDDAHTFFVGEQAWLVHNTCVINYGTIDPITGQRSGITAYLEAPLPMGRSVPPSIEPPGFTGNSGNPRTARGHLLANILGGDGTRLENVVTIVSEINGGRIRQIEVTVRDYVVAGGKVEYTVIPVYDPSISNDVPVGFFISAQGNGPNGILEINEYVSNTWPQ
jgi:hypothetical protein